MNKKVVLILGVIIIAFLAIMLMRGDEASTSVANNTASEVIVPAVADTPESQEMAEEIDALVESEVDIDAEIAELEALEF